MNKALVEKLTTVKTNLSNELTNQKDKLKTIEESLHDTKLNPYGVTSIDFSERQELLEDILKMEGCVMGIDLALETCQEDVV
tara:strand:- start:381 stop:626 length:246 start_codon:yes stop_codon:yes gene_type:complete